MKKFEIDFNGNVLALIQIEGDNIKILACMDGGGNSITDKTIIKEL